MTTNDANDIHRAAIIVDGHCDAPYRMLRRNVHIDEHDTEAQADLRALREGGVTASFFAAYVPPSYAARGAARFAHRLIDLVHAEVARRPDAITFCDDSAGIREAKRDGKLALLIGLEGGHAIEDSLETLRLFYDRGVRYMTLTHVNTNNWCDSSGDEPRHGGLTDFGRQVVRTMNDLGMIVDISHVSDDAFHAAIETTRMPLIASHSSCRALCRHPRNLTDDMLRTLARNGGVCMINFFSAFVNDAVAEVTIRSQKPARPERSGGGTEEVPNDSADWDEFLAWYNALGCPMATLDDAVDHIVHAAEVAGVEHVGIGSDFDGVPALPTGLETAAGMPLITARLLERGVSEADVLKILGGNFLRVFEQVERA